MIEVTGRPDDPETPIATSESDPMGKTEPAVSLRGLTKRFGALRAVDTLSLEIQRGETVALLGPNGAGKSTTVSMLLGLLAPDGGTVSVLGMPRPHEPWIEDARGRVSTGTRSATDRSSSARATRTS